MPLTPISPHSPIQTPPEAPIKRVPPRGNLRDKEVSIAKRKLDFGNEPKPDLELPPKHFKFSGIVEVDVYVYSDEEEA